MRGIVFFDVGGTLVPQTSSSQYLAGHLGHLQALKAAEDAYAAGDVGNYAVSLLEVGRSPEAVRGWLHDLPLVEGIPEAVAWCRSRDLAPVLATLACAPVGDICANGSGSPTLAGRASPWTTGGTPERSLTTSTSTTSGTTRCVSLGSWAAHRSTAPP